MSHLTAADEARIAAIRIRLAGAGYPADDLPDERIAEGMVLVKRKEWWEELKGYRLLHVYRDGDQPIRIIMDGRQAPSSPNHPGLSFDVFAFNRSALVHGSFTFRFEGRFPSWQETHHLNLQATSKPEILRWDWAED